MRANHGVSSTSHQFTEQPLQILRGTTTTTIRSNYVLQLPSLISTITIIKSDKIGEQGIIVSRQSQESGRGGFLETQVRYKEQA